MARKEPVCLAPAEARDGTQLPAVWRATPASRPEMRGRFIAGMGAAFLPPPDTTEILLRLKPGKKAAYYSALMRLMWDKWPGEHVLYHTECGRNVAVMCPGALAKKVWDFELKVAGAFWDMLRGVALRDLPHALGVGEAANTAAAAVLEEAGLGDDYLKIIVIFTEPPEQRKGLGSAMMRTLCAEADRQGKAIYLEASHEGLVRFYERFGFQVAKRANLQPDAAAEPFLVPLMLRPPGRGGEAR